MAARKRSSDAKRAQKSARTAQPAKNVRAGNLGKEHFPSEDEADPEDSARLRRHPGALEQGETGAANRPRPVDDDAWGRPHLPRSGTLSSAGDTDQLPVVESGLPVDPEDFGRQFLSTATQQDNFESELWQSELEGSSYSLGQLISEATLEASGQEGFEIPETSAFRGALPDADLEPPAGDFDMLHDVVREASLFDRRLEDVEVGDTLEQKHVDSDDTTPEMDRTEDEDARQVEARHTHETLQHGRGGRPPARASAPVVETRAHGEPRPQKPPGAVRSRRDARHSAHIIQTSRRAAKIVAEQTGLEDFDQAMTALEVVVSGIARRLAPPTAGDFLAQLPSELRHRLAETVTAEPEIGLTLETIESELARRLDVELSEAKRLVGDTGTALEHLVSHGEIAHVCAQLPRDIQSIFSGEVAHGRP